MVSYVPQNLTLCCAVVLFVYVCAKENIEQKQSVYKEQFDKSAVPHNFSLNDLVLYTKTNFLGQNQKLSPKWLGPAEIIKLSDTNAMLKLKKWKRKTVSSFVHRAISNRKTVPRIQL